MTNLLEKLRNLIQQRRIVSQKETLLSSTQNLADSAEEQETVPGDAKALNATIIKNLMEMLDHTHEGMYSCEDTFALLDEYVELIADNDEEATALMPYVKRHLDECPDCHEVYATLLNILQSDPSSTASAN